MKAYTMSPKTWPPGHFMLESLPVVGGLYQRLKYGRAERRHDLTTWSDISDAVAQQLGGLEGEADNQYRVFFQYYDDTARWTGYDRKPIFARQNTLFDGSEGLEGLFSTTGLQANLVDFPVSHCVVRGRPGHKYIEVRAYAKSDHDARAVVLKIKPA